jgi:hypothetical protein
MHLATVPPSTPECWKGSIHSAASMWAKIASGEIRIFLRFLTVDFLYHFLQMDQPLKHSAVVRSVGVSTLTYRSRANSAHMRHSRPDSGLGLSHFQSSRHFKLLAPRLKADGVQTRSSGSEAPSLAILKLTSRLYGTNLTTSWRKRAPPRQIGENKYTASSYRTGKNFAGPPPSSFLATILKLSSWVCGTNPSTLPGVSGSHVEILIIHRLSPTKSTTHNDFYR